MHKCGLWPSTSLTIVSLQQMKKNFGLFLVALFHFFKVQAETKISVMGKVTDPENLYADLSGFMVVNLNTQQGFFGKPDGSFSIELNKNDTLVIAVTGYEFYKVSYADSSIKTSYNLHVRLKPKQIKLPEVRILAPRDLDAIQNDIAKLGYRKDDYVIDGVSALESPITFLYQEFSRRERLKRNNAILVNEEKKRILLKELLARYVADDIIKLNDTEFDQFVDFCNVPEEFMKKATQYDFMVYIKNRYSVFSDMRDYYRPGYIKSRYR